MHRRRAPRVLPGSSSEPRRGQRRACALRERRSRLPRPPPARRSTRREDRSWSRERR
ncbi:hypothetical protein ACFPRL_05640 [Pseudoclavibacter helvolus]